MEKIPIKKMNEDFMKKEHDKIADNDISVTLQAEEKKYHTLLLVEDTFINQKLGEIILKKLGFHVELAENGYQAVEMCKLKKYSLILMDCQMPMLDGYEATKVIKNYGLNQNTAVIAMTAHVMDGDREKCLLAGMDDYISKPISISVLDQTTKKWLTK